MTSAERLQQPQGVSWELPIYGLLLAWFAARVGYLALELHPYVPPDEITHIGRVLAYAKVWGVPDNGPGTFHLGLVDHRPWLYYWVMARVLAFNFFAVPDLIFARCANGLIGLATAWVGILWVREWCEGAWARILFAILITNTLMFTGLFASVSYDNGVNLLAAAAMLALAKFREQRSFAWLLGLAALVLAGCITKRTFLPLAFFLVLLLLLRERNQFGMLFTNASKSLRSAGGTTFALLGIVVVLAAFSGALYGGNLVRYGRLQPRFDQIVSEQDAMANRIFARSRITEKFHAGEVTLEEAKRQARRIRHKGDRSDTLLLLQIGTVPEWSAMGRVLYMFAWTDRILKSSVGYEGHRRALKSENAMIGYALIFGVAAVMLLRRWHRGAAGGIPVDAAFLVLGYAFVLMWFVNYPSYQASRWIELGLQGRYMFPVLVPIHGLVSWAFGELAPQRTRVWLVGATGVFFLYGDLPWMLGQIGPKWYID